MTPLEFLAEEFENVRRALTETLRYDYGPERSREYYDECKFRLDEIGKALPQIDPRNTPDIAAHLNQLAHLANWISLIERSHLGEFSWPFSEEIRRLASTILREKTLAGNDVEPIIHVVSEGHGYRIVNERFPTISTRRRVVVVAFPRPLKHHVLLHAIFGHELGHTALYSTTTAAVLKSQVVNALIASGPLANSSAATTWLNSKSAPLEIQGEIAFATGNSTFNFNDTFRLSWLTELICDLFGLLLFGPAFLCAHRTILESAHPNPFHLGLNQPTHPPYAVRQKMLVRAMHLLGWNRPVTNTTEGETHEAEKALLQFILNDPFPTWSLVFDDTQIQAAITGIKSILNPALNFGYSPTNAETIRCLVDRLKNRLPPILEAYDNVGTPMLSRVDITQTLYAGWIYWLGKNHFTNFIPLKFFETNRLCDHALLQQRAINDVLATGTP